MTVYRWKNYDRYKSEVNQVREYYDAVHRCHRLALESLLPDQAETALDIACGHGESTCILEPFAKNIVGVDSSEDLIDIAKQQNKHAATDYVCTPFSEFEAPEQSFDIISSAWYLNHVLTIEELESAIDKVARLLKRGGGIAFVVPGNSFTTRRIQEIARRDFQWRQAWTHERPESTEGVFSFDGNWIQTRVWQPFFLMKFMSEWFDIHAWDVKGTLVTEGLLQNLVCEPPFEVLYGYRR
ncbi:class I SAM-dependent DNA methyltransferase [Neorhodopirellula lusitana]|uniref:class I SAM-dependent DNA methyltransferase n=1 Tax=Neorhodopirellula lusitana TaxID=445327 RepID=UPI003850687D